jgi:putative chitinase
LLPSLLRPDEWAAALDDATNRFEITSAERVAAFLAQVAEESNEFRRLTENLDYSTLRLMQVWPKRFVTAASAAPYAHLPEKLANHVYAGRLGNGDEASGDGWRYRGRGLLQVTGRENYQALSKELAHGFVATPDDLATITWAAVAAGAFWQSHGLNALADQGSDLSFATLTRVVNGAELGLDRRRLYWSRARRALGLSQVSHAGSHMTPMTDGRQ